MPEREDAVVAQITHDSRIRNFVARQVAGPEGSSGWRRHDLDQLEDLHLIDRVGQGLYDRRNLLEQIGVSPDKPDSHKKFISKYRLPFPLLCDPDHKVMEKYGAWGEKIMYGQKKIGVIRSTTVIGPDGTVLRHWKKVPKAEDHPRQVLEYLRQA